MLDILKRKDSREIQERHVADIETLISIKKNAGQDGPRPKKVAEPLAKVEKSEKTLLAEDSKNLSDIENLEMSLIKALNEIHDLKTEIKESRAKTLNEVKNIYELLENLSEQVKGVQKGSPLAAVETTGSSPQETIAYNNLRRVVKQKTTMTANDEIDFNILRLIRDCGAITSRDLLVKAEADHICSKNTLYNHLNALEERNMIVRKRDGHN